MVTFHSPPPYGLVGGFGKDAVLATVSFLSFFLTMFVVMEKTTETGCSWVSSNYERNIKIPPIFTLNECSKCHTSQCSKSLFSGVQSAAKGPFVALEIISFSAPGYKSRMVKQMVGPKNVEIVCFYFNNVTVQSPFCVLDL